MLNEFFNANIATDRLERKELHFSPLTNIFEGEKEIVLELLVPGFEKDEIKLSAENDILTVKSEWKKEDNDQEQKKSRIQFQKKNFEKKFRLSDQLDQKKIQAEIKNGVLKITLTKKEEAIPVKRQIEIG